jgi:hypothetical protein
MKNVSWLKIVVIIGAAALFTACAGTNTVMNIPSPDGDVAGFWFGLWNGFISPLAFIVSLFDNDVSMYEVHNNGGWYDFGFLLGLGVLLREL